MSQLILPSKRIIQPGYPAQINPEFRNLVTSLVAENSYGSYTGDLLQHDLGDFTKSGTVTDNTLTAQGKGVKGNGSTGHFYRSISVPSQAMWLLAVFKAETVSTALKIPYSLGSSTGDTAYTAICSGNGTANNLRAFFRGTSTGGIAIAGPTPVAGNVYSCLFVVPSAAENDAYLCVNGAFYNAQESASTDSGFTATFSYETLLALKRTSTGQYSADTLLLAGYGLGVIPQALAQTLSANPWQLFAPQKRVIYFDGAASGGGGLTGANSDQANTTTTGAVTQTHHLTGADSSQANTATTDAITQTQLLTGLNGDQTNASATGAINQTHSLTGLAADQANASTGGAITQDGSLVGAACTQTNTSTTGNVSQTHILAGANSTQANNTTTGAVTFPGIELTASNCTQANNSSTGAITSIHQLLAANGNQIIVCTTGAISQTQSLTGANASQTHASSTGAISFQDSFTPSVSRRYSVSAEARLSTVAIERRSYTISL